MTECTCHECKHCGKTWTQRGSKFVAPSVEEVTAYCVERGNNIDPEAFLAYYESNGWKRGNTKITNWKMAVITWERRQKQDEENKVEKVRRKDTQREKLAKARLYRAACETIKAGRRSGKTEEQIREILKSKGLQWPE